MSNQLLFSIVNKINKILFIFQIMNRINSSLNSLNKSTSKQRYSFPKSPRFSHQQKPITDSFYNLPTVKSSRSTSFGFGHKDLGIKYQKVWPTPETYHIQNQFKSQKKGFSFGEGRQDMELTGPLSESLAKKHIPSPNLYFPKPTATTSNITLKSRIKDRSIQKLAKFPGPGTYKLQQIGSTNYYITSGHQNKINYKISTSPKPDIRGNFYNNPNLGPGSYDLKYTQINKVGEYFNSKIKNTQARSFSKQNRPDPVIKHLLVTPGPTKYQQFSDFRN